MLYIVCVKLGDRYDAEYVNKLYRMVERNTDVEYKFVCFTDNPDGIIEEVVIEKTDLTGWWGKLEVFKEGFAKARDYILVLDLDTVIVSDLDAFIDFGVEHLANNPIVILENLGRPGSGTYGSAIFMIKGGSSPEVYSHYIAVKEEAKDMKSCNVALGGDQDFIKKMIPNGAFFPREWIYSYKIDASKLEDGPKDRKIVCFHGHPRPHEVSNGWVKELWQ